jgi:hypothetical protein
MYDFVPWELLDNMFHFLIVLCVSFCSKLYSSNAERVAAAFNGVLKRVA